MERAEGGGGRMRCITVRGSAANLNIDIEDAEIL